MVLLVGDHIGQFRTVSYKFAKLASIRQQDKTALYHSAHEEIADPYSIFAIGLVTIPRLRVLGMRERNIAGCFKDAEDENPVLVEYSMQV